MSKEVNDNIKWYKNHLSSYSKLSKEEELDYIKKAQNGDITARNFLIENNLMFIINQVNKYYHGEVEYLDLVQEGTLGLIKAIEKFSTEKNIRFLTYSRIWIKQSVTRAIKKQARIIKLPENIYTYYNKYNQAYDELTATLSRYPTMEEVIEKTGLSSKQIKNMQMSFTDIQSLNEKEYLDNNDKNSFEIIDSIQSEELRPDEIISNNLKEEITHIINECNVTDLEKAMIKLKFGLESDEGMTDSEIGSIFSLSKQRVNVIINRGLNKIKESDYMHQLAFYLPESNLGKKLIETEEAKVLSRTKKVG